MRVVIGAVCRRLKIKRTNAVESKSARDYILVQTRVRKSNKK